MTNVEKSKVVAKYFGWWDEDQKCSVNKVNCQHFDEKWFNSLEDLDNKIFAEHEIPPPDLTDLYNFNRLLKELNTRFSVSFWPDFECSLGTVVYGRGASQEEALLDASYLWIVNRDK